MTAVQDGFFVAGGTVPPGSPSYVERFADRELYEALLSGEYGYVLNSRQMGKSSLAVRTVTKLSEAGVRTAFVDLTRIGGANVSAEQWYAGLLAETGRVLDLRKEAVAYLREHRDLGAAQRYLGFLQEVALPASETPLIVMIDEIDAVRSLSFSTDELFAGIRQLHNGRSSDPELKRLTFCLLGAALPSDLIRDPRTTPFNVGKRIELRDCSIAEARGLSEALGSRGAEALQKVFYWTAGHPFLTQTLCSSLAESKDHEPLSLRAVDALVRERYLDARARETDTNLADVGNRLLGRGDPNVGDQERADTLSLYDKLLKNGIPDDESNPSCARIKMSGIARLENGQLRPRNRIYREVFGKNWIRENMPGQELRRQRRAFWKGAIRAGLIGTIVTATIAGLAVAAVFNERKAQAIQRQAEYDTYVATMQGMESRIAEGDREGAVLALSSLANNRTRGWEWGYWSHVLEEGSLRLSWDGKGLPNTSSMTSGPIIVADTDTLSVFDPLKGTRLGKFPVPHGQGGSWNTMVFRDGRRALLAEGTGQRLLVVDLQTGATLRKRSFSSITVLGMSNWWDAPGDKFVFAQFAKAETRKSAAMRLDLDTLELQPLPIPHPERIWSTCFSPDGRHIATREADGEGNLLLVLRDGVTFAPIRSFPLRGVDCATFTPDGKGLVFPDGDHLSCRSVPDGGAVWSLPKPRLDVPPSFSPDGKRMVFAEPGKVPEEYELGRLGPRLLRRIPGSWFASYVAGARQVLACDIDLRLFPPAQDLPPKRLAGGPFVRGMLAPDGDVVLWHPSPVKNTSGSITRFRGTLDSSPTTTPAGVDSVDSSGRFLVGIRDDRVIIRDLLHQRRPLTPDQPVPAFWGVAADPEGRHIAMTYDPTTLAVYNAVTGESRRFGGLEYPLLPRFSRNGLLLAEGDSNGGLTVWETRSWKRIASKSIGRSWARSLAFDHTNSRIAMSFLGGDAGVFDVRSGAVVHFRTGAYEDRGFAWSHDGRRLAGAVGRRVRLWDPTTGRELGVIGRHDADVLLVWFTPDDRTLCSVDTNGVIKTWKSD